jgi:hypothetical protein
MVCVLQTGMAEGARLTIASFATTGSVGAITLPRFRNVGFCFTSERLRRVFRTLMAGELFTGFGNAFTLILEAGVGSAD